MGIWDRVSRRLGELTEELLPSELKDKIDGARALLERGQAGAAAAALEEILRDKPDHTTALYLLGVARLKTGEAAEAAATFERAHELRGGFAQALVGLGEARMALGDAPAALAAFREAREHAGGERALLGAAYRGLGQAHLAMGAPDKAVRELRKALAEDAHDAEAATALGEALLADPDADPDEVRLPLERA